VRRSLCLFGAFGAGFLETINEPPSFRCASSAVAPWGVINARFDPDTIDGSMPLTANFHARVRSILDVA